MHNLKARVGDCILYEQYFSLQVSQMLIAWCVRNATSQSVVCSAATVEQFNEILGCLPV